MLFGVECIIINLYDHQLFVTTCFRFLIFRRKTAKNIPNISKYFLVIENAKTVVKRIA